MQVRRGKNAQTKLLPGRLKPDPGCGTVMEDSDFKIALSIRMWFQKKSLRRLAVAQDAAISPPDSQLPYKNWIWLLSGTAFFVLMVVLILLPNGKSFPMGATARTTILSPVSFSVPNPSKFALLKQQAQMRSPAVLKLNAATRFFDLIQGQLTNLPYDVAAIKTPADLPPPLRRRFPILTANTLQWLHNVVRQNQFKGYARDVRLLISTLKTTPVVDQATWKLIYQRRVDHILVPATPLSQISQVPGQRIALPLNRVGVLGPKGTAFQRIVRRCFPEPAWKAITAYLAALQRPSYLLDIPATTAVTRQSVAAVQVPRTFYHRGDILAHEGQKLAPATRGLLLAAHDAYLAKLHQHHPWLSEEHLVGADMVAFVLTLVGVLYLEWRLRNMKRQAWTPAILVLLTLLLSKTALLLGFSSAIYLLGLGPIFLVAIILSVGFDQRFAVGFSMLNALLVKVILGQGMSFFLAGFIGSVLLILLLGEIRTRTQLLRVGSMTALVVGTTVLGFGLLHSRLGRATPLDWLWLNRHPDFSMLFHDALLAGSAVLAAVLLSLLLIPVVEQLFRHSTAMTLLELSDTNRPLLRRLAMEAPGTFNHSLIVGVLAEAAARQIGANALLCRVGAYYHDVGKLLKAGYFVENTGGRGNRHEKLSPAMSVLIVVGHVKDGLELAREYHLPEVVQRFIGEHHGTTVVEYFYQQARERQAREELTGGEATPLNEMEFRYPGPRPQSRETAILMICDGVESMVRSLAEPTAARIEGAVHQMIMKRLLDGQFDQCDLTLRDLGKIEQCLVRTLAGVHHARVAYPVGQTPAARISRPA